MLIKKLVINNFRQFIGEQVITFSTDKKRNVTVLIGVNTSGKTTFVRAFEWILYAKNEFDDKILLNKNVADNLHMGDTAYVSGKLFIEHNGMDYEISRRQQYTCTGTGVRPSNSECSIEYMQQDGQTKTKLESEFNSNIARILPRELSSYFFFGGERVGAISSREDIADSIKGLMGLDILFNAITHLKAVVNKLKKSMDFSGDQHAIDAQKKLDAAYQRKQECDAELQQIEEQLDYYNSEKEKYAALLRANEQTATAQKRREQLDAVIKGLQDRIEKDKKDLVSAFSRNSFAYFSLPLLKKAVEMLESASDSIESVPDMSSSAIDYILSRKVCICGTVISPGSAAEHCLLAEKAKQPPEHIGSVVRHYREQAMEYISSSDDYYETMESRFVALRNDQRELSLRVDERNDLDKTLKDAKDIHALEREYQNACRQIENFNLKQRDLIEKIGSGKRDIDNYEKALESYSKANQKNLKISMNLDYANAVYEWVSDAYKSREESVRQKLEDKVNSNFSRMYHGSRTIMIDEKYRVKYLDVTTEESDGLKAVKSFAFVAGLVDLAKEALASDKSKEADIGPQYYPLVMDAPFSNVDEMHIQNISTILPASAEQVIIAVMQKDWEPAAKIMAPVVGKSYTISKDTDRNGKEIDTMSHIIEC